MNAAAKHLGRRVWYKKQRSGDRISSMGWDEKRTCHKQKGPSCGETGALASSWNKVQERTWIQDFQMPVYPQPQGPVTRNETKGQQEELLNDFNFLQLTRRYGLELPRMEEVPGRIKSV